MIRINRNKKRNEVQSSKNWFETFFGVRFEFILLSNPGSFINEKSAFINVFDKLWGQLNDFRDKVTNCFRNIFICE